MMGSPSTPQVTSVKDLYLLLEEEGLATHQGDNKTSSAEEQSQSPIAKEYCFLENTYKQVHTAISSHYSKWKVYSHFEWGSLKIKFNG